MHFYSTRDPQHKCNIDEALVNGIAPDGGLYLPSDFPNVYDTLSESISSFQSISKAILTPFLEGYFSTNEIDEIIDQSFFFDVPVIELTSDLMVAELFHGPTLAFKDFGGQFMAATLSRILKKKNKRATILVATSGDTGGAVAQGFFQKENTNVVILYPKGKVSELQELQLTTFGGNIKALCVEGTFDDCQRLVKTAFADKELSEKLSLSSANSINIGRLLPQMTYYAYVSHHYFLENKNPIDIVVPSGNFGNITAALFVKKMGFPIGKLIAATNANDVVPNYFSTGVYTPSSSVRTLSNAMDVGAPSNMERILSLYGNDLAAIKNDFESLSVSDEQTKSTMQAIYKTHGYIADPHTAVGIFVAQNRNSQQPIIVMSTAHPAKFKDDVEQILDTTLDLPTQLSKLLKKEVLKEMTKNDYQQLKSLLLGEF